MKGEGLKGKGDAEAALAAAFKHIAATRMAGLPIVNPQLQVEVIDFQSWQGYWLGVLLTPWSLGLVLCAGESVLPQLGLDEKAHHTFPSGKYTFMGMDVPEFGHIHLCPLISPMHEFTTQQDAVATAHAVMQELLHPPADQQQAEAREQMAEAARLNGESVMQQASQNLSRRDFLRGGFLGR